MYVLILTLFGGGTSAPAVAAVNGFTTITSCLQAGHSWELEVSRLNPYNLKFSYICVPSNH